jgi:hypothetical protein
MIDQLYLRHQTGGIVCSTIFTSTLKIVCPLLNLHSISSNLRPLMRLPRISKICHHISNLLSLSLVLKQIYFFILHHTA